MRDLVIALEKNTDKLKKAIAKRYKVSVERAKAEYNYRAALGEAMAIEKMNGMAATALYEYCRGLEYIAKLREKRDIAVAQENYLTEMIWYYRTEIKIAEGQIEAERKGV